MINYGWVCPKCGKCLNPNVTECICEVKKRSWEEKTERFKWTSESPCVSCPNKNNPYCFCTLCTQTIY